DIADDPVSAPAVGPLIPANSADLDTDADDQAIALPESEPYDPAEYRWVPVRRRPRHDGWTEEKQRRFIEALADTGLVSHAAKAVGMGRASANRLRRSPHGAAFARAWDAARLHAGAALEDIAFERAIEGVEHNVYNEYGEVVATKHVVNDRMLTFLLSHLKPERYGKAARALAATADAAPPVALEASLRAMEPPMPAPPEQLLDAETLADEIEIAEIADGVLPHFLSEQRAPKTEAQEIAAQRQRGKKAWEKQERGEGELSDDEFRDMCHHLDPTYRHDKGRKRYR
ncbi:MAG: hypothetical protein ABL928_11870, partial [Sphingorhabdus sp.]